MSLAIGSILLVLILAWLSLPATPPEWEFRGVLASLWYLNAAYSAIIHRLRADPDPLPVSGPAIVVANHTCNIDHFLLQAATGRKLAFLIAREYYEVPAFRPFCRMIGCVPVEADGKFTAASRASIKTLEAGNILAIFPEGRMNPDSGDSIGEGKPGVAFIALKAKVPIFPAYIRGTPRSKVFWKSFLTPSNSVVVFGKPILLADYLPGRDKEAERAAIATLTTRIMDDIWALRGREPLDAPA